MNMFQDAPYQGTILKVFIIILGCYVVTCGDIPRLVAFVLGVSKLLSMAKDVGGFLPIVTGEVFFFTYWSFHFLSYIEAALRAPIPPSIRSVDPWKL